MVDGEAIESQRHDGEDGEEGLEKDKSGSGTLDKDSEILTAKNCGEPNFARVSTLYPFIFQANEYATSMPAATASMRTTKAVATPVRRASGV